MKVLDFRSLQLSDSLVLVILKWSFLGIVVGLLLR
jgi:hypothetical protein